ncbi:MAG: hypothetical protein HRU17_07560 [Polyangiaceae bacterium]|nr:hypothetical protein [Polyangiaceae bacterium]
MERRINQRARTDFGVIASEGIYESVCRGIEISTSGIVLDRGREVVEEDKRLFFGLEICLPERHAALFAVARPVWHFGSQQAFRIIEMSDVDRLNIAEHVDLRRQGGAWLS